MCDIWAGPGRTPQVGGMRPLRGQLDTRQAADVRGPGRREARAPAARPGLDLIGEARTIEELCVISASQRYLGAGES